MLIYFFVGRPLLFINTLLNLLFEKSMTPWKDFYIFLVKETFRKRGIKTKLTGDELWEKRKEKGEKPFIAFIGLLFIVAGFILQFL